MSYEKQTWKTGDVVTSGKLNHMEDGIASGGDAAFVHFTVNTQTFQLEADKTFVECVAESAKMMHQMPIVADCFGIIGPLFPKVIDGSVVAFTWTAPRSYLDRAGSDLAGWSWEFGGVYFITVLYTADGVAMRTDDYIEAANDGGNDQPVS